MAMNLSKLLPTLHFGPKTWQKFWNSIPNNANDSRSADIFSNTDDLHWQYLGNGKPQEYVEGSDDDIWPVDGNSIEHYCFPQNYNYDVMQKTIQGNYRKYDKVQIWIGTSANRVTDTSGFYKIIYDPANEKHTLTQHDKNGNILWTLGFSKYYGLKDGWRAIPMAINYK